MSNIVIVHGNEWKPHYTANYTQAQLDVFARQPHPCIDSRCLLERFRGPGVEVVMSADMPVNAGRKVLIKQDGFWMEPTASLIVSPEPGVAPQVLPGLVKVDFTIWTITVPLVERFAHVFKGMQDRESRKYRVWCY